MVYAGYAIAVGFEWFPFLNSVGNIVFIVPYRMRVLNWLRVSFEKIKIKENYRVI